MDNKLIPTIVQDYSTGQVLMLAYMNKESINKSIETGTTWFWSRTRKKLWNKGETSGNIQKIKEIRYDCDGDSLLVLVEQVGDACHTGNKSCFYRKLDKEDIRNLDMDKCSYKGILEELYEVLQQRIKDKTPDSYTYSLHKKGLDEIIKKVGEESIEVVLSAKHQKKEDLIYEVGDLIYHLLLLLVEKKISLEEIYKELESRRK
ncbi:MAG: bifunctional phosphoribosyl-AMP cyclohydrolase/phosphoribosyl-ATP diphosphatase HisIE [Actinomycetota bacterium]